MAAAHRCRPFSLVRARARSRQSLQAEGNRHARRCAPGPPGTARSGKGLSGPHSTTEVCQLRGVEVDREPDQPSPRVPPLARQVSARSSDRVRHLAFAARCVAPGDSAGFRRGSTATLAPLVEEAAAISRLPRSTGDRGSGPRVRLPFQRDEEIRYVLVRQRTEPDRLAPSTGSVGRIGSSDGVIGNRIDPAGGFFQRLQLAHRSPRSSGPHRR